MRTKNLLLFLACLFGLFAAPLHGQWKQCNGPYGGKVSRFALNGTAMFAGVYDGGVYLSNDNGSSWKKKNNGLSNLSVIAIEVLDDSVIIVATFTGGVFRSTDNGDTWVKDTTTLNGSVMLSELGVRTLIQNNGTLYAGTEYGGVLRSTDKGKIWMRPKVRTLPYDAPVNILIVKDSVVFAGLDFQDGVFRSIDSGETWISLPPMSLQYNSVKCFTVAGNALFAGSYQGGVFRSVDNGETWVQVNKGLPKQPIRTLAVKDSFLFVGMDSAGVYRSSDSGKSWTRVNSGLTNLNIGSLTVSNSMLFAGTNGNGIYRSPDNGENWVEVNRGLVNQSAYALAKSGNSLFVATFDDGGVYRSNDIGESWLPVNHGLEDKSIYSLGVKGTTLFAGGSDGAFRSTDNGETWLPVYNYRFVNAFAEINSTLFMGTEDGIFRSTNLGDTWIRLDSTGNLSRYIKLLARRDTILYAGLSSGIYTSSDLGSSWTKIRAKAYDIGSIALKGATIIAGATGGAYRSTDNGVSWQYINVNSSYSVTSLVVSDDIIFASTEGGNGVSYSIDDGETWTRLGTELSDKKVQSLIISGSTLIAGTLDAGIWKYDISTLSTSQESNNPSSTPHLTCSPNPSTTTVTINCSSLAFNPALPVHYTITSLTGSALLEFERAESRFTIPTDDLASGVYYVVARQGVVRSAAMMSVVR